MEHLRGMGGTRPLPADDLSADKMANAKATYFFALFRDSLVCCSIPPWTIEQQAEIVRAITGWSFTTYEALKVGERVANMGKLFNLHEGITSAQDVLPKRMFQPTKTGPLSEGGIDPKKMQAAIQLFYGMMGWDEQTGVPSRAKLGELGLGWAAEAIEPAVAT